MTSKELYLHIELFKDLQYEIKTLKENISTIKLFLHDLKCENIGFSRHIEEYCNQESQIMELLIRKEKLFNEIREYLMKNCNHNWENDFTESAVYTNVRVHPFKTCSICGITKNT